VLVAKECGDFRCNEPLFGLLVPTSHNDRPTAFTDAELGTSVRDCYAGLGNVGFPFTRDEREGGLKNLPGISVVFPKYDPSSSDIDPQAFQGIAACEYSLSGISHEKKAIGSVTDQGMKKLDAELG